MIPASPLQRGSMEKTIYNRGVTSTRRCTSYDINQQEKEDEKELKRSPPESGHDTTADGR